MFDGKKYNGNIEMKCRYHPGVNATAVWEWVDPYTNRIRYDLPKCEAFCPHNPIKPGYVNWNWSGSVCILLMF